MYTSKENMQNTVKAALIIDCMFSKSICFFNLNCGNLHRSHLARCRITTRWQLILQALRHRKTKWGHSVDKSPEIYQQRVEIYDPHQASKNYQC